MHNTASPGGLPQLQADERVDLAAEILGAAFVDDPLFATTLTNRLERVISLPLLYRCVARQFITKGWVDLSWRDERAVGAAIWCHGRHSEVGWAEVVSTGMLRLGATAGVRPSLRLMRAQDVINRTHRELMGDSEHLYLYSVGVLPGHQGRGVGSELLARGLARADEAGLPTYLETSLARNAELYRRHGFQVLREDAGHGYHTWFMLRAAPVR